MADTIALDDIVKTVVAGLRDLDFALSLYFNGGPITVTVKQVDLATPVFPEDAAKVTTFSADPFFRKPNYYIATGSMIFPFDQGAAIKKSVVICALFSNMFAPGVLPGNAHFRLQLSSPYNSAAPPWPVDVSGDIPAGASQNVIVAIRQA